MPDLTSRQVIALALILLFVLGVLALYARKDIKVHLPFGGSVEVRTPIDAIPAASNRQIPSQNPP